MVCVSSAEDQQYYSRGRGLRTVVWNMLAEKRRFVLLTLSSVFLFIFLAYNSHTYEGMVYAARKTCPAGPILTVRAGGNTANNIWEYLSVLAISKLYPEKNFAPYIPDEIIEKVQEVFDGVSLPAVSTLPEQCRPKKYSLSVRLKDPPSVISNMKSNAKAVILDIYSSRYDEVLQYGLDNVRNELRFRTHDVDKANEMLNTISKRFHFEDNEAPIFVSVHYRGGDYIALLNKSYRKTNGLPTFRFYNKAMDYFKKLYKNVIFIVVSIDYDWLSKNLKRLSGNLAVNPYKDATKVEDLVLLSHCNHSIINYGTFGVTAAMMSGGTTIVYDLGVPLDHKGMTVGMGMAEILPNWMKMDEKKTEG